MDEKPTYQELEKRIQQLEHAFQKGEEKYRILLDESSDPIFSFYPNGAYRFVNQAFAEGVGKSVNEIVGHSIWDIFPGEEGDKRFSVVKHVFATGKLKTIEVRVPRPEGDQYYITTVKAVKDNHGKVTSVICSSKNITDRKQTEETLRESEERHRLFFENAPIGIIHYSNKGIITAVNEAMVTTFGSSREALIGLDIDNIPNKKFAKEVYKSLNGKPGYFEGEYSSYTGKKASYIKAIWIPIKQKGEILSGVGIVEDITERKKAEEALRLSQGKLSAMLLSLTDNVSMMDRDLNILWANDTAKRLFGEDLIGKKCYQIYHGRETPCEPNPCLTLKAFEDERSHTHETQVIGRDGQTIYFHCTANVALRDENGNPRAVLEISRDISDSKQTEEALRESEEKLARAKKMEALGLLAGGIAHDLNNVLSGIVSYPELLLLALPQNSKLREPIEAVQRSGHRAVAIVQDLLTVARGVATAKEPLNLNDIVSDYLNSPEFKKLEHFHPTVTVKTDLETDLLNITGSHVHIRKVVMNLVSNASEAVEGGGHVTISTVNRYIAKPLRGYDDVNVGEYVVLAVSDDGSGISSDDLERIFEPFYTKKVMGISGTGLGLAVVWNVVQDHKGYIDVPSDENGTTFELYFPITRDEISDEDLSIPIKDYKGNGETILVVDDLESQREISCKMLDILGYKTKAVCSGEEAVEYLRENTVDLLLLDMIMDPGINGRETYERIIEIHPNQKAIIISGFAETEDVKEAQKLGAGKYIKKPLTLERIGMAVKEELEKK